MAQTDQIVQGPVADFATVGQVKLGREAFVSPIVDFFQTNPIARASKVMAEASALAAQQGQMPVAAE